MQEQTLEPGSSIARELRTGETHAYKIPLGADEYLALRVEQRGIDVTVNLVGPDGVTRTDANRAKGPTGVETLSIIAETAGDYRLDVRAAENNAPKGSYEVVVATRRAPTASERTLEQSRRLFDEARTLRQQGKYTDALSPAERALDIRERVLGADDLAVADSLDQVAVLLDALHEYAKAEAPNLRALAIREKALGPDHPDVAHSLFNLAWLAQVKQDFSRSESLYRRALDIQERALGPDHSEVATVLNDLALLYQEMGRLDDSIRVNERVLAIREKALGPDNPGVAKALHNVANVYENKGDYVQAEALMRRALRIWEHAYGPDHPEVAYALDGLAAVLHDNGDYTAAEPLLLRALAIREKVLGPEHGDLAQTLDYLAGLYRQKGDATKAESLCLRGLAIREKRFGPNHSVVASSLINLAAIHVLSGEPDKAEPLYRRALTIQEASLGPTHLRVGVTLNHLGQLVASEGRALEAETLFQRALTILEHAAGTDYTGVATSVSGLAELRERVGDRAQAERYYQRALAIQEKAFGPDHPTVAQSLERLAALAQSDGDTARAVTLLSRAYDIRERQLDHNLVAGSERQKLAYLTVFADDVDRAVSLHASLGSHNADALRLAFTTILARKGRAVDATSDNIGTVRANASPEDRERFDRLASARSRLATVTLRGPSGTNAAYQLQLARLRDEVDRLEADLGARSLAFRAQSRPVTLAAVQAALPEGAALVEYVRYRPHAAVTASPQSPRYAAYLLARHGDAQWVDLGDAAAIDQAVSTWRRALGQPDRIDARRLARALDARVMQPIRALIGDARHLLISPDGQLNLIPFAALADERHQYLLERYTISYLTSGRDLLRLQVPRDSRANAVIVAAPAFGEPAVAAAKWTPTSRARVDESQMFFGPLPGSASEVRSLRALLPEATVLTGGQATEAALRRLSGPRILHVATHGFFLDGAAAGSTPGAATAAPGTRLGKWVAWTENPLLRSGLALAGANQGVSGADDGVLTALEAAGLDLWGTKLVVLSACDTGVGEVRNGDGVYGLRRALVLAGSESQMMSLWPVSDRSTRNLMVAFYTRLAQSAGRAEALRQAQLSLLHDGSHGHPFYWAAFIQSGEWGSLSVSH